ncbi:hypothetical protein C0993_000426 [Termitomyces sp. T159_Od127]|nr:hypothetical protein C0993_000426 [Termitomyces sp. T159_Od127]
MSWIIRDNVVWEAVLREDVLKEEFGKLWGIVGGALRDENGLLSEVADNDKIGIEALMLRELDNVVHQY